MNVRKILKVLSVSLICIAFLTPIVLQLEANKEFTAYKKEQYLDMLTEFREQLEKIRKSLGAQVRREVPREPVIITEKMTAEVEVVRGLVEGENTTFSITDSRYLNVTITSSENVKMRLESTPKMVSWLITPINGATSTFLTISGLEPEKTYYRYQEGHLEESMVADENGEYSYTQEIETEHHVYFLDITSTIYIREDGSIEGTEDIIRQVDVYQIINDLQDFIIVERENTTIEGNGHLLQGPNTGYGIYSYKINNVDVRNLRIANFSYGINFILSSDHKVSNCEIANITEKAIYQNGGGDNLEIIDNKVEDCYLSIIKGSGNYVSNVTLSGNDIINSYGIRLDHISKSTIINNRIWRTDGMQYKGSITLGYLEKSLVANNNISDAYTGFHISSGGGGGEMPNNNIIINNTINNSNYGIQFYGSLDTIVRENTIKNSALGIWVRPTLISSGVPYGDPTRNITIEENRIENCHDGIHLGVTTYLTAYIDNVRLKNNYIEGCETNGILVYGERTIYEKEVKNYVEGNYINDTFGFSLKVSAGNTEVKGNEMHNSNWGMYLLSANSNYTQNTVSNCRYFGLNLHPYAENNTIEWNNFYDTNLEKYQGNSQANDDGVNNIIRYNFWNDWTTPDDDNDGFVDIPYNLDGTAGNCDPYPLALDPLNSFSDPDHDLLLNYLEEELGTNPLDWDSDNDDIIDGVEYWCYGTDPLNWDSDSDGFSDGFEVANGEYSWDPFVHIDYSDNTLDGDGDGLPHEWEVDRGTDPYNWDSDGDGLSDYMEICFSTDPLDSDSDGDGFSDGFEYINGDFCWDLTEHIDTYHGCLDLDGDGLANDFEISIGIDPLNWDSDEDDLSDYMEIYLGTNPNDPDSDGDGFSDGFEYNNGDFCWNPVEHIDYSNNCLDLDGDRLSNYDEINRFGTDAYNWDSDGDNLSDYIEIMYYDSDPLFWDSDFDGFSDGFEVINGDHCWNPTEHIETYDGGLDLDGDGLPINREITFETDPLNWDTDGDLLSDYLEIMYYGSDPLYWDSDGDNLSDGFEVINEYDPLDSSDPLIHPDASEDPDFDNCLTSIELEIGTDPYLNDTDGDGYCDGYEISRMTEYWDPLDPLNIYVDYDHDGLANAFEFENTGYEYYGTDPYNWDTDGDGLLDGREVETFWDYGGINWYEYLDTNPLLGDTDGDGYSDSYEVARMADEHWDPLDPLNLLVDYDHDGLINAYEYENTGYTSYGTDPYNWDTDGDGLLDGREVGADGIHGANSYEVLGTNPLLNDTDSDGYTDKYEISRLSTYWDALDPLNSNVDYDFDGLVNFEEYYLGTDPCNWDTDGDGLLDGREVGASYCIHGVNSYESLGTDPLLWDSDGDGYSDGYEVARIADEGWNALDPLNPFVDYDSDGLFNKDELEWFGTDPYNWDTDGDGLIDGREVGGSGPHGANTYESLETDPLLWDTDSDGYSDYFEVINKWDPLDSLSPFHLSQLDSDFDWLSDSEEIGLGTDPFNWDTDSDGIPDAVEFRCKNTDPLNADSDYDGLTDTEEIYHYGTDPNDSDSDKDSIPDGWEVNNNLNPLDWYDSNSDPDLDELTNYQEYIEGTNPQDEDTDNDLIRDDVEILFGTNPIIFDADHDEDGLSTFDEILIYYTRPLVADSDFDGIDDYDEIFLFETNPQSSDTDLDGLTDYDEIFIYDTNPNIEDSDGDNLPDGWEVDNNLNPLYEYDNHDSDFDGLNNLEEFVHGTDPWDDDTDDDELLDGFEVTYNLNPLYEDTDFDGMPDGWEVENGLDPWDEFDALCDSFDYDLVSNLDEYLHNSSPWNDDTDGDGISDFYEIFHSHTKPDLIDSDGDELSDYEELVLGMDGFETSPLEPDTDFDGISDYLEFTFGTDPTSSDTDEDNITDYDEIYIGFYYPNNPLADENGYVFTDPLKKDTDGDSFSDYREAIEGLYFPTSPEANIDGYIFTDPCLRDSDGDDIHDHHEFYAILQTDPVTADTDEDGIDDGLEVNVYHTNPLSNDTDGDGCLDLLEIQEGTNPLDPVDSYTPTGTNVEVIDPTSGVTVIFENIIDPGITSIIPDPNIHGAPMNFIFSGVAFYINTTADFTGKITLILPYSNTNPPPVLLHMIFDPLRQIWCWGLEPTIYDPVSELLYAEVDSFSLFAIMSRTVFGESVLSMSPSYQQGDDLFVTSDTFFSLSSNVSVPYFEYLYYRINGGDWIEYLDAFSISGLDGVYTIDFYGIDFVGAVEEIKSITVNLVSLEIDSYFTECENGYFDVIFRKSKEGGFELVTTNPGVFIYRAEILNSWPALIDNLTYAFTLPADFIFSGTNPIHICLDGVDITPLCIIDGTNVIIFNIPSGALITVELHLKYALRGCLFPSLEEFTMKGYQFLNSITAFGGHPSVAGDGLLGSYSSIDILVAHQKKVTALAGFIYSSDGAPIFNALIELYDANNQLVTTTYSDESGFFYFLDLEAGVYSLQVVFQDQIDLTTVTAIKNEVVIVEVFLE